MKRTGYLISLAILLFAVSAGGEWLSYDNGQNYNQVVALGQGNGYGVKFVPGYEGVIYKIKVFVGRGGNLAWDGFYVGLYAWNGTLGQPGGLVSGWDIEDHLLKGTGEGNIWAEIGIPGGYYWSDGNEPFVIGLTNVYGSPNVDTIWYDSNQSGPTDIYFVYTSGNWSLYNLEGHNMMVRVYYSGMAVESNSLGKIKAVYK